MTSLALNNWAQTFEQDENDKSWRATLDSSLKMFDPLLNVFLSFVFPIIEPANDKTYNKICVTSKDSDQPVHPLSMAGFSFIPLWIAWRL